MTNYLIRQSTARRPARSARRSNRATVSPWLLAMALAMTAQQGWSACTVSAEAVSFGSYDVFSNQSLDSTGNISLTSCLVGIGYSISLSPGGGSYASRSMANGAHRLDYNLYTDAARTIIWGDGTGATAVVSGLWLTTVHRTVYGRIPARQNAYVGSYSDTITVTVTF